MASGDEGQEVGRKFVVVERTSCFGIARRDKAIDDPSLVWRLLTAQTDDPVHFAVKIGIGGLHVFSAGMRRWFRQMQ